MSFSPWISFFRTSFSRTRMSFSPWISFFRTSFSPFSRSNIVTIPFSCSFLSSSILFFSFSAWSFLSASCLSSSSAISIFSRSIFFVQQPSLRVESVLQNFHLLCLLVVRVGHLLLQLSRLAVQLLLQGLVLSLHLLLVLQGVLFEIFLQGFLLLCELVLQGLCFSYSPFFLLGHLIGE